MFYNTQYSHFMAILKLSRVFLVTAIGDHLSFFVECDKFSLLTMIQNQISDQTQNCITSYFNMFFTLIF